MIKDSAGLTVEQKALYLKLLEAKGVKGMKITPLMLQDVGATETDIEALQARRLIFVGKFGGVMVFSSPEDIENNHPTCIEERKKRGVARLMKIKSIEAMLLDVVEEVGLEALRGA